MAAFLRAMPAAKLAAMGHTPSTLAESLFRQHLLGGILVAAGIARQLQAESGAGKIASETFRPRALKQDNAANRLLECREMRKPGTL